MNYRNGLFQILHKPDGTYLKIFPAKDGGKPLKIEEIFAYLNYNKIGDYDLKALQNGIETTKEPIEILLMKEKIPPIDEYLKIAVNNERMVVVGRFYPPSSSGKFIDKQDILAVLAKAKIKYGISEKNIDLYLKGRQFCTNIALARGKEAVQGKSASITYHFNQDITFKPTIKEDGSVDFHHLDSISNIEKGALLATLSPAQYGEPGMDVYGNQIRPFKVVSKVLKHGKNIHLSEDGLRMYSDVSGHVSLTDDTVFVSNIYEIPGDVGTSTGDIDYDGNVLVKGNVITGYMVRATGDVIVEGVVEGASIYAGNQIILSRGIQGMGRGTLEAKGDIITKFIESSKVTAGGMISTDAIMHSTVSAKGDILVNGKRGLITGGEIKSGGNISLKTAGSTMGTTTVLSVGMDPVLIEQARSLEKQINEIQNKIEKEKQVMVLFKKKLEKRETLNTEKKQILKSTMENKAALEKELDEVYETYTTLKDEMDEEDGGIITVQNVAYSGVKIIISNIIYYVKTETHHSRFIRERADIKIIGL